MTPDSAPESAPDPTPDRVDGSPADGVDGVDEALASAPADGTWPVDPAQADSSFNDVASGELPPGDLPSVDVPPADVWAVDGSAVDGSAGDVAPVDVPPVDVAPVDVAPVDVSPVDVLATAEEPSEPDPILADSVELAHAAAVEVGGDDVGRHLGVSTEDAHAVTHAFVATLAGYRGWHWAVTVARSPESSTVTVDEVVLLPGDDALRAPEWVPWSQRVRAGDLGAGDLLPADPDDARLVPSYFTDGDPSLAETKDADRAQMRAVADEIGLGRVRVLSRDGRLDAAERWFETDFGPDAPMAKQAPAHCGTCGFLVAVSGSLGAAFGICANELSAADARVVSVEFGCGAHSEAGVDVSNRAESSGSVYDSGELVMESTEPTPSPDEPAHDEAAHGETTQIEPAHNETTQVEPAHDETTQVEPAHDETTQVEDQ